MGPWQPFERPGGWYDGNYVGGADEGRAAYIMVALLDAETNEVIPGHVSPQAILAEKLFLACALCGYLYDCTMYLLLSDHCVACRSLSAAS